MFLLQTGKDLAPYPGKMVARGSPSLVSPLFFINQLLSGN
jgi:hypothetical protein